MRYVLFLVVMGCAEPDSERKRRGEGPLGGSPNTGAPLTGVVDPCLGSLVSVSPEDGAIEVSTDVVTRWTFTDPATAGSVRAGISGPTGLLNSTSQWDGEVFELIPDQPLEPETTYDVELDWACGTENSSYTTAAAVPLAWEIDLSSGVFVSPAGLSALSSVFLSAPLLMEVRGVSTDTADLRFADSDGKMQDRCVPTSDSVADYSAPPSFVAQLPQLHIEDAGADLLLHGVEVSGELELTLPSLSNVNVSGTLDMSTLEPLVGSDPCALLATFGVDCEPCPWGGPDVCLFLDVQSIPPAPYPDPLWLRDLVDIASDPSCP